MLTYYVVILSSDLVVFVIQNQYLDQRIHTMCTFIKFFLNFLLNRNLINVVVVDIK